ncbi:MAG: hypothetical protein J5986_01265 [Roseburia sp.]|nr:hypothetical protein [Roseburia sp.]
MKEKRIVKTTVRFDRNIPEQDKVIEILKKYCSDNDVSMGVAMTYFVLKATGEMGTTEECNQEECKDNNESREFQEKYKDIYKDIISTDMFDGMSGGMFGGMSGEMFKNFLKYESEKNEKL